MARDHHHHHRPRAHHKLWQPEFSRSTLPLPLFVDLLTPSELPRTLLITARSCLCFFHSFLSFKIYIYVFFFNAILVLTDSQLWGLHGMGRHNTRQRILQLVKDTSAKLKSVSESDRDADVNVMYHLSLSLLPTELLFC